jgi:hypothetical protein
MKSEKIEGNERVDHHSFRRFESSLYQENAVGNCRRPFHLVIVSKEAKLTPKVENLNAI